MPLHTPLQEQADEQLAYLRTALRTHGVYGALNTLDDIRSFMELHVFAVWDFMSLLKSLQSTITCVRVPWTPSPHRSAARLINEIVHGEESDIDAYGASKSHFEMYLDAMDEIGADAQPIRRFIAALQDGYSVEQALTTCSIDSAAAHFVRATFSYIDSGKPHVVGAAFTLGREEIIPDMFLEILAQSGARDGRFGQLVYYLERHVELDGDTHGPLALQMLDELCGSDPVRTQEALAAAEAALHARIKLWDGIAERFVGTPADTAASDALLAMA